MSQSQSDPLSVFLSSRDGLRLHYLDYKGQSGGLPVVCLPGLTRPAEDFDCLGRALAQEGRRVVALDYRGRGESQWDPDWSHYTLDIEQDDIFLALAHARIEAAVFVGTSRGGLHAMRIAKSRLGLIRAAVLNDIGPSIDTIGLLKIKRYVGKLPPLPRMADAIALTRMTASASFSAVSPQDWETYARRSFVETPQGVKLRYDPALSHTLDDVTEDMAPFDYWEGFMELVRSPVLTLRGENSDLLTPQILQAMAARAPAMEVFVVPGQAHAPLLLDEPTIARVTEFIRRVAPA